MTNRKLINGVSLNALIGIIYDAATDPGLWPDVLKQLAQLTASDSGILLYQDNQLKFANSFSSYGLSDYWLQKYNAEYGESDPSLAIIASVPTGQLTSTHLASDNDFFYDSKTYKEFYLPQNIKHLAGSCLIKNEHRSALIGLQRSSEKPEFELETLATLGEIVPHIQRALHIRKLFIEAQAKSDSMAEGINNIQTGIFLFDNTGHVIFTNDSAKAIIKHHPAIKLSEGSLLATSSLSKRKLSLAIKEAVQNGLNLTHQTPASFALKHSDASSLPILVMPIHQSNFSESFMQGIATAIMMITNPEHMFLTSPELLSTVYDFTHTEAQIAIDLTNALTPAGIAKSRTVSEATVRTHIRAIYNKMGITSHAQLVKTILSSPLAQAR